MSAAAAVAAEYVITARGDNGEFINWATLALIFEGETIDIETFTASSEFPGPSALDMAISYGEAFVDSVEAPYGSPEWEAREFEREIGDEEGF